MKPIKIISWNVNGIRAAQKKGLFDWLQETSPDILCLQETKAWPEQLDEAALAPLGYQSRFMCADKKGYSGVAFYFKKAPLKIYNLDESDFDQEGRTIIAEYSDFTLINGYFPNSQSEGKRLDYKLAYNAKVLDLCNQLKSDGKTVIVCGDLNVAHKPIDLTHPKPNEKNPGYLPEERLWMDTFLKNGFIDSFRYFNKEPQNYTWWSYRAKAREKNVGWRLDYFIIDEPSISRVEHSIILKDVMGSDHCPIELSLKV